MSRSGDWSPDEPMGTETFEQRDEAIEAIEFERESGDEDGLDDPELPVDERELEEAGIELDDPEQLVTLDGGMDDPDGLGGPSGRSASRSNDEEGWDLDRDNEESAKGS